MATNQFVLKSELFNQLRSIFNQKQSGMLTLLTDTKKSVLMRFSGGELTSARCRSWDVVNTIEALLEAETVKFSYINNSSGEDKPPLMSANDFMLMIEPGGSGLMAEAEQADTAKAAPEPVEAESGIAVSIPEAIQSEAEEVTEAEATKEKEDTFEVDKATTARMNYF